MQKYISYLLLIFTLLLATPGHAGEVSRAQFTSAIIEREPVDQLTTLSTSKTQVYYFSELLNLQGHTVTHQWIYNYKVLFEKPFAVGSTRWRVWSNKTLRPGWSGTWTVNTVDEDGTILLSQSFEYL
jgi:hypothetical protein